MSSQTTVARLPNPRGRHSEALPTGPLAVGLPPPSPQTVPCLTQRLRSEGCCVARESSGCLCSFFLTLTVSRLLCLCQFSSGKTKPTWKGFSKPAVPSQGQGHSGETGCFVLQGPLPFSPQGQGAQLASLAMCRRELGKGMDLQKMTSVFRLCDGLMLIWLCCLSQGWDLFTTSVSLSNGPSKMVLSVSLEPGNT